MQDNYYNSSISNKNTFEDNENPFYFESIEKYIDNYSIISEEYVSVPSTNSNSNNINENSLLYPSFLSSSLSNTPKKTPNGLSKYLTSNNLNIPALPISQPIESESVNSQVVPTSNVNNSNNLNSSSDLIIPTHCSSLLNNNNNNINYITNENINKSPSPQFNKTQCNNNQNNINYIQDSNNNQNIPMYNNHIKNLNNNNNNNISIKKEKKKNIKQLNNENTNNNNNINNNLYNSNINHQNNSFITPQSFQNSPNYSNISIQEQEKMQLTSNCFNLIQYCNQLSYYTKQAYNNPFLVPEELDALSTLGNYIQFEITSIKNSLIKKPLKDSKLLYPNSPRCQYEQNSVLVPNSYSNSPLQNTSGYYSPLPEVNQSSSNVFSSAVSSPFPSINNSSPNTLSNKAVKKNQIKSFKQSTTYINLTENMIRAQTKKNKKSSNRVCLNCKTSDTPEWRRGPQGAKTLCNACGIRYRIQQQQPSQQLEQSSQQPLINEDYNNKNLQSNNQHQYNNYEDQYLKC